MAQEILLINIGGRDKSGLMAELTGVLTAHDARLLDIGQAVIHDELALGVLVSVDADASSALEADIRRMAGDAGSSLRVSTVTQSEYASWLGASGQNRHILTLLVGANGAAILHSVSALTRRFSLNIDTVRRLTHRGESQPEGEAKMCIEMRLRGTLFDVASLREALFEEAGERNFDFSLQNDTVHRRNRRLVAFDMDSTLIAEEVMDELAARHGVGDRVAEITARAMAGELDFKESFRARAALLEGMPVEQLERVARDVNLNTGARRLLRVLKHFGYKTAILSGGFQYVGDHLKEQFGIDYVFANALVAENGRMTGAIAGDIVDSVKKAELLAQIAGGDGITLAQTIAIGDGANDLPMLSAAGLGIAFHAKPIVRASADHAISNFGLDAVLYLMGFSDLDIEQALAESV